MKLVNEVCLDTAAEWVRVLFDRWARVHSVKQVSNCLFSCVKPFDQHRKPAVFSTNKKQTLLYSCRYIVLSSPLLSPLPSPPPFPHLPPPSPPPSPHLPPLLTSPLLSPHPQPTDSGDPDTAQAVFDHYLVELSALTASGQDTIGTEMKAFADHLKPYPHHTSQLLHSGSWIKVTYCPHSTVV